MRALLAQLPSGVGDVEADAFRVADALAQHPEVDFAVFPELFLGGYDLAQLDRIARTANSSDLAVVADAAGRHHTAVVVGFAERFNRRIANAAACFDNDGRLIAVYRKVQLFGGEAECFSPGDTLAVISLGGRRVGVLICFDIEFPELARQLALAGADLLVTVSANMAPYYTDHELISRARAIDNRLPHLYVNLVGASGGYRFVGGSRAVAPDGATIAEAGRTDEELLVTEVPDPGRPEDASVDYLAAVPSELAVVKI